MRVPKEMLAVLMLLGLFLVSLTAWAEAADGKQIVLVFTTDTEGELNPCG